MNITLGKPLSQKLRDIVTVRLTTDTVNDIGRKNGFQNGYATKLFEGVANASERNHELIINVCREAFRNV